MVKLKILLIQLRLIPITEFKISAWISMNQHAMLVQCLSSSKDHRQRRRILKYFHLIGYSSNRLVKVLIRILKYDFINNSILAKSILERIIKTTGSLRRKKIKTALNKFDKRLTDQNNLDHYHSKLAVPSKKRLLFDKSQMVRLETVRQQLKKPIWYTP